MMSDAISRVKTCSPAERGKAAVALAHAGTEEAIAELIRMVEGEKRRWFSRYDLRDQLIGIGALGASGRKEALRYLKRLYAPVQGRPISLATERIGGEQGVFFVTTRERTSMDYPNAKGELRERLNYEVETSYALDYGRIGHVERRKWWETDDRDRQVHQVLRSAIQKLEQSLKASR